MDDKSKANQVQIKGRFSVTSENLDLVKVCSILTTELSYHLALTDFTLEHRIFLQVQFHADHIVLINYYLCIYVINSLN